MLSHDYSLHRFSPIPSNSVSNPSPKTQTVHPSQPNLTRLNHTQVHCSLIIGCLFLRKFLLNMSNGLPRIQMLWTDFGTIHNRMTTIKFEGIIQFSQPLILKVITRILNPPICLHQYRGSKVLVSIPPVGWTCRAAACAEDTFVHTI